MRMSSTTALTAATGAQSTNARTVSDRAGAPSLGVVRGRPAEPAGDDRLGHRPHGHPAVHGGLLDEPEGLRLGPAASGLEQPLGPVDGLTGLPAVLQRG